jgi:hypothetical protein
MQGCSPSEAARKRPRPGRRVLRVFRHRTTRAQITRWQHLLKDTRLLPKLLKLISLISDRCQPLSKEESSCNPLQNLRVRPLIFLPIYQCLVNTDAVMPQLILLLFKLLIMQQMLCCINHEKAITAKKMSSDKILAMFNTPS